MVQPSQLTSAGRAGSNPCSTRRSAKDSVLPKLLAAIEFKCNNTAYRPVMDALELLARYADVPGRVRHFAGADQVPVAGVVPEGWLEAVVNGDGEILLGRRYRRTRRAAASRRACPSTAEDEGKGEYPLLSTLNV
jgi:hypothetical protein